MSPDPLLSQSLNDSLGHLSEEMFYVSHDLLERILNHKTFFDKKGKRAQ